MFKVLLNIKVGVKFVIQDSLDINVHMNRMEDKIRQEDISNLQCIEHIKSEDDRIALYEEYYNNLIEQQQELISIKMGNINTRLQYLRCIEEQKRLKEDIEKYKRQSEHDELTGLPNRYLLNEYCNQYFKLAYEHQKKFGVIVIDVDHFKEINEFYGHLGGDQSLTQIADIIRKHSNNQFCARFGGDEFFVITYDIEEDEIIDIANKIKEDTKKIAQLKTNEIQTTIFTVSQGYVLGVPSSEHTYKDFWKAADIALFEGKKRGKNCISIGDPFIYIASK